MLSNINVDKHLRLQIVLVGQPELRKYMCASRSLRQFAQRIGAEYHIGRLSETETVAYVEHRLRVAGSERLDLFDPSALSLAHESSRGIPRLLNQLCDTALVYGYADQCERIDAALMLDVIRDRVQAGYSRQGRAGGTTASEDALKPISVHHRRATELHEDRAPLPRAQARGVVQTVDRAHRAALRRQHVRQLLPRPETATARLQSGRWGAAPMRSRPPASWWPTKRWP